MNDKLTTLLPKPRLAVKAGGCLHITEGSSAIAGPAGKLIHHLFGNTFKTTACLPPYAMTVSQDDTLGVSGTYILEIGDSISVTGSGYEGIACALQTLAALKEVTETGLSFPRCRIEDAPFKSHRGVHLFLPPPDIMDEFLRILDTLASLKYNLIILETGGGVEFDRHPEVNAAWRRFCREVREYPGGPQGMQASESYWKDSTHVEICGSGVMSKKDLRRIVDHCAMLGLEIVPEIQALSHSYYLTMAHPEIAERPYERWPDSYCPSCEESYQLYFELAEEVLEVIQPRRVSIGHDEVRVLGECPRCKGKSGHELLAYDINRLHAFYKEKGISIMMWGEMLQNFQTWKGVRAGGIGSDEQVDRYGRRYQMIPTYEAADMVTSDILLLDWYHARAHNTEDALAEKGFCEIYGNFHGQELANWEIRSRRDNVLGAEVSTWCVPNEYEMGFNCWFYDLTYSAQMLWRDDFCDAQREAFDRLTENHLPLLQEKISGKRIFDGSMDSLEQFKAVPGKKMDYTYRFGTIDENTAAAVLAGGLTPLAEGETIQLQGDADAIVFFHAANEGFETKINSWSFRDKTNRMPAHYVVDYEDGMSMACMVEYGGAGHYGAAIGHLGCRSGYYLPDPYVSQPDEIDDANIVNEALVTESPAYMPYDVWRGALIYACRFAEIETADGIRTIYSYEWKNPYPGHKITGIRYVNETGCAMDAHLYAAALVKR